MHVDLETNIYSQGIGNNLRRKNRGWGKSIRGKPTRKCPECSRLVIELPAHMCRVHAWDKGKARVINALTYQRKTILKPKKIGKPDQKHEHCPFRNCNSFVYSLPHHIKKCHGTSKKSTSLLPPSTKKLKRSRDLSRKQQTWKLMSSPIR